LFFWPLLALRLGASYSNFGSVMLEAWAQIGCSYFRCFTGSSTGSMVIAIFSNFSQNVSVEDRIALSVCLSFFSYLSHCLLLDFWDEIFLSIGSISPAYHHDYIEGELLYTISRLIFIIIPVHMCWIWIALER
jgi:hypothetical protein